MIPALGSGRYAPGPNIVWPSWLNGSDPNYTINACWRQPGLPATVSTIAAILTTRKNAPLQALLEAIQAADTLRLAERFTDEVAGLVRQVLRDSRLVSVDVCLADYDGPAQLSEAPKESGDLIAAFSSFLTRNSAAARQANPGKTVRLNLKAGGGIKGQRCDGTGTRPGFVK